VTPDELRVGQIADLKPIDVGNKNRTDLDRVVVEMHLLADQFCRDQRRSIHAKR
jgi:hypothetical protein